MIYKSCGLCQHGNFAQGLFESLGGKREAFTIASQSLWLSGNGSRREAEEHIGIMA